VAALAAEAHAGGAFAVDLRDCSIATPAGRTLPFAVDPLRRESLLDGLDDIGLTLKHDVTIRAWQARDRLHRPWAWPAATQKTTPP
jgi:3-isopropylmalate/(R)-2-methylmalate dehydratase small subunit